MNLQPLPSIYDAESLRRYLKKFAPGDTVGARDNAMECTIACWLEQEFGLTAMVSASAIYTEDGGYAPESWLTDFVNKHDAIHGRVTAAKALAALDAAEREAA